MEQNKKIIANAVSAYFMIFISLLFLLNKENKYLNNTFVKSHTKTACIIHIMFLVTYIVFVSFGLGKEFSILGYGVNTILASVIFIGLLAMLLYGIYRANKGEVLTTDELLTLSRQDKLTSIEQRKISEQEKVSIILSYIPILGYIIYGQNYTNSAIKKINKVAMIAGVFIALLLLFSSSNLALLFTLLYIVFVVFSCIILISKEELLQIHLESLPGPEKKIIITKALGTYMKNYFGKHDFVPLKTLIEKKKSTRVEQESINTQKLSKLKDTQLPKILIYIPFFVLLYLPKFQSKQKIHIKNSLGITLLITLSWLLFGIDNHIQAFALFPISYGIGFIERIGYKMPYIYDIYEVVFERTLGGIVSIFKKGDSLHKTEKREKLVVKK